MSNEDIVSVIMPTYKCGTFVVDVNSNGSMLSIVCRGASDGAVYMCVFKL